MSDQPAETVGPAPEHTEEDLHNMALSLVDVNSPSAEFVDEEDDTTEAEEE